MVELYKVVWPQLTKWALTALGLLLIKQLSLASLDNSLLDSSYPRNGSEYRIIFCNFSAFPFQWALHKTLPISHFVCGVCLLPGPCDLSSLYFSPELTVPGALCPATFLSWLHPKCMFLSVSPRLYFPQMLLFELCPRQWVFVYLSLSLQARTQLAHINEQTQ